MKLTMTNPSSASLPRLPTIDSTRAFFREGYPFIGDRCASVGSDAFLTRIMLRPVVCMMGADAAARFYDGIHFTRVGAMPAVTLRLLQDKGSVQSLDGSAHRARKARFLELLTGSEVERIGDLFDAAFETARQRWRGGPPIMLHDAMATLLCDVVCRWSGIPLTPASLARRRREMTAMIAGASSVGLRAATGLVLRQRSERWSRHRIAEARASGDASVVGRIANLRDADGALLPVADAAVELLNLIRPTVAVARFITFAALALHEHRAARDWLDVDPDARVSAFVDEVRRYYPFFPVIGGRVRRAFTWRGHHFREGDWALLGLYATNHDPRAWEDPGLFRPQRFIRPQRDKNALIPQGAGDHHRDHRCPGEWITTELMARAIRQLRLRAYHVPDQNLHVPLNRFPTLPESGFVFSTGRVGVLSNFTIP